MLVSVAVASSSRIDPYNSWGKQETRVSSVFEPAVDREYFGRTKRNRCVPSPVQEKKWSRCSSVASDSFG